MTPKHVPLAEPKPSPLSLREQGKQLRETVPRSAHAAWEVVEKRSLPLKLLALSNRDRLEHLIPLRHARMRKNPLAYFRGSALVMAADLAQTPSTGIMVQACGDGHLQNFGWFASPERSLLFDITDFDETYPAPWEWDLKRLLVSVALAARLKKAGNRRQAELVALAACTYREQTAAFAQMSNLDIWYFRLHAELLAEHGADPLQRALVRQVAQKAQRSTVEALLPKLTQQSEGKWAFVEHPPWMFHPPKSKAYRAEIESLFSQYLQTLQPDRRVLIERFQLQDVAFKVVGVGSVGLRCGVVLLSDADHTPLLLQVKEARPSVLARYLRQTKRAKLSQKAAEPLKLPKLHEGDRVVQGQRLMQAASDLFLGWATSSTGTDYYFRQLRDMKVSLTVEAMALDELTTYVRLTAWALARAHAKSGEAGRIDGYLGAGPNMDDALVTFALAYADQTEQDFLTYAAAIEAGKLPLADESLLQNFGPLLDS